MTYRFLVARVVDGKPYNPSIVECDSQEHEAIVRSYDFAKPGAKVVIWALGAYPSAYLIGLDGQAHLAADRGV